MIHLMYRHAIHEQINAICAQQGLKIDGPDNAFYARFLGNASDLEDLYLELYAGHPKGREGFTDLLNHIAGAYRERSPDFRKRDSDKEARGHWFLSNELAGMSLYVDRFCGTLAELPGKLDHFRELGVNLLHLMPIFESPENASDGGYAVSDFRRVDPRFGSIDDLRALQGKMQGNDMYLMLDIVLNHTSDQHEWARKAKEGDTYFQDHFYFFPDRDLPDAYESTMPEIFPESSPGSFTWIPELGQWVMTVFHHYQWDLNYRNPMVFISMLDNVFFYANLGVDILRIDAPAFLWKQLGTTCQNLPEAHTILRLIKVCTAIATPGMAILGEAIVAPQEIMKYFGTGNYSARECDFAYNATQMALQWDALATGDTRIMLAAQHEIMQKPYGTSWITYTRCHDDIGLGYADETIASTGADPREHRIFLQRYYTGQYPGSPARGALFSANPRTGDARISGSLASLCGLESALGNWDPSGVETATARILMMQAHSIFIGGLPMLFYGDELGYVNDYSWKDDPGKHYDNRWMHRPPFNWEKNARIHQKGTTEASIFGSTRKMLELRRSHKVFSDLKNMTWLTPHNIHVAGYLRRFEQVKMYCLYNFSNADAWVTWHLFKEHGQPTGRLRNHWTGNEVVVGPDHEHLVIPPYGFMILEEVRS
jgi:amylosucrase